MGDQSYHGRHDGYRSPYEDRHKQRIEMERAMMMQQTFTTSGGSVTTRKKKPEGITDEEIYYSLID